MNSVVAALRLFARCTSCSCQSCCCMSQRVTSNCRYAKRAKEKRLEWGSFTRDYFLNRETLANVLLLIDASIPPTEIDLNCSSWLAESQVPFSLVFTKIDKRKKGLPKPAQNIAAFKAALLKDWEYLPYSLQTSSQDGTGKLELAAYIASLREMFLKGDLKR